METVEFVGGSAAGKSTVAHALQVSAPNVMVRSPYHHSSYWNVLARPWIGIRAVHFLHKNGGWRVVCSKRGLNWVILCSALSVGKRLAKRTESFIVYDQLIVQAIQGLATVCRVPVSTLIRTNAGAIDTADRVVALRVPPHVVQSRRAHRDGAAQPDRGGEQGDEGLMWRQWRRWLRIRRALKALEQTSPGSLGILVLDGTPPPEQSAAEVRAFLGAGDARDSPSRHVSHATKGRCS